jgi:MFS family permease
MTAARSLPSSVQAPSGRSGSARSWSALTVLMFGTFMFVLDFFIVNVALPSIQHGLRASEGAIEWVVAGYTISTAVLLVTGGRLGDRFGRRRVFAVGMAIFVATSATCALAPNPAVLVAARVVQGVGAALMAPNILSILGVVYTGPARIRAISIYGMVMGLAATSGQLIGGILIRTDVAGLGWRTIFWINVPLGVAALLAAPRLVPESRDGRGSRLDLTGVALITACLIAVVLPLVEGRQAGWPAWSWAALASAVPLAIAFAVHQRRKADRGGVPLLNPRVFASWPLRAGLLTQTAFWCQQAASYLVLGLYLQQGRSLSPLAAGGVFTFLAVGYLITSFRAPALTMRFGRRVIAAGAMTAALGDAALYLATVFNWPGPSATVFNWPGPSATAHAGTGGPVAWLFPGLLLLGAGQGLCITPLTTTVLSHAEPATAGSVSGALSTAQQVGNSVGVPVTGVLFFGALSQGYGLAFERSTLQMGALLLVVAALTRLMPGRRAAA